MTSEQKFVHINGSFGFKAVNKEDIFNIGYSFRDWLKSVETDKIRLLSERTDYSNHKSDEDLIEKDKK